MATNLNGHAGALPQPHCAKSTLGLSSVAGILDRRGSLRVVVTQRWRMRYHVAKGERLFVLPDLEVQEPVPWDDIPPLIERVQKYVSKKLAPTNACGDCMLCCILPYIKDKDFEKPSFSVCPNCAVGHGCKLYQSRPKVCRQFECEWLKSQSRNDRMPPELRPDRCGAYFSQDTTTNDPLVIECHGTPNSDSWAWINDMQSHGYKVREITYYIHEPKP